MRVIGDSTQNLEPKVTRDSGFQKVYGLEFSDSVLRV